VQEQRAKEFKDSETSSVKRFLLHINNLFINLMYIALNHLFREKVKDRKVPERGGAE
jgi:hypothetical protein